MLNFGDLMTIANDNRFQTRCAYCLNVAAVNVLSESSQTPFHAERIGYAKGIIQGGFNTGHVARNVLTNPTIAAEALLVDQKLEALPDFNIPDGDIQFTINSLFNDFAGIGN